MRFELAAALFLSAMSGQAATRQIDILIPPGVLHQPAENLSASIGTSSARVLSISSASKTPAVIVADLAATPIERHACLLQEIAAAMTEEWKDIPVYASAGTMRTLFYPVEMADGLQLGLLSRLQILATKCKESLSHPEKAPPLEATVATHELIRALGRRYASRGPLRVFWLSTDFHHYDWRTPEYRTGLRGLTIYREYPALPELLAESLSEAQMTLFPILVRVEQRGKGESIQIEARQHLAHQTGGLTLTSTGEPGAALRRLITESLKYPVVRLEIPDSVPLPEKFSPTHLHLQSFDRIFVTGSASKVLPLEAAGILVTRYSTDFAVTGKCPEMQGDGPKLRLHLPEHIAKSPPSVLQVHIEALRPNERSLRQRLLLERPGLLCVALQDAAPDMKHLVVVHDEKAHWTAIFVGELN